MCAELFAISGFSDKSETQILMYIFQALYLFFAFFIWPRFYRGHSVYNTR